MTAIPEPTHSIAAAIDAAHASAVELPRPHMGASLLGHHCDRYLWLSFRWAMREAFPGRILRLFRRGHMEEATVVDDLRRIGCIIASTGQDQSRASFGSHVSGSVDGVITSGIPGAEKTPHILEIKTHSKKSFDQLEKDGVQKAKPMHYTQMQVYMMGLGLDRALYYAVCKDDDRIYTERVRLDRAHAEAAIQRGKCIATADRIPEPCAGASASWYQCKFCPAYAFCHQGQPVPERNCRTCGYSTAKDDGFWRCEKWQADIPTAAQHEGCDQFEIHPHMAGGA